jgi:hypothetical protein
VGEPKSTAHDLCRLAQLEESGVLEQFTQEYGYACRHQEEFKARLLAPYRHIILVSSTSPLMQSVYAFVYHTQLESDCKNWCTYSGQSALSR